MIQEFVDRFMEKQEIIKEEFRKSHPSGYSEIVKMVVETITDDGYDSIDPQRIHEICDGDHQGTLLFVVAAKGYQPSDYWYVKISYGSCSVCDTLQGIRNMSGWDQEFPTEQQVSDYFTLALHVVQGLKKME